MEAGGKSRTKSLGDVLGATTSMIDKIPPPMSTEGQEEATSSSSSPRPITFEVEEASCSPVAESSAESKVSPMGWKASAPSDRDRRQSRDSNSRVMRRTNSGTRQHAIHRADAQNQPHEFFEKSFLSTSASSISSSHGPIEKEKEKEKEKEVRLNVSPISRKPNDSANTQKPKMKRQLSGMRDKQKLIEEEIMRWSGGSGPKGEGEGGGEKDKQAEIARQVAMWASAEEKKRGPKPAKVVRYSSDQHAASSSSSSSSSRKEKTPLVKGDTVALIYRNKSITAGKYGLALWKTNTKVRTVTARIILKNLDEGDIILSRVMDIGRTDLVSKTTFSVSPSEAPASVELIVSHSRCSAESPISVTLQLLRPGGAPPVDIPLPLEHHERERVTMVEAKRPSCVKLWRSLLINVVGARDIPPQLANIYVTVHIGANFDRTTTLWNCTKEQPMWRAHFDFELRQSPDRYFMVFTLWEASDKSGKDTAVSQIRLPLCNLLSQELLSDWFPLDTVEFDNVSGKLHVQMIFEQESLLVKVLEGVGVWEDTPKSGKGAVDTDEKLFVMVQLGKSVRRTKLVSATSNPSFAEEFLFSTSEELFTHEFLFISVWNADETVFIGQIKVPLFDIKPGRLNDQMYPLCSRFDSRTRTGAKKGKHGDLKLEMQYTQSTILSLDFYRDLLNLLIEGDGSLLLILGKIIPSAGWEKLARILANIFYMTGSATRELSRYAIQEIENTSDPRVLFRGNTLVTKLIDAYQKIVGLNYLKSVIQPTIKRVYELRKAIELDPLKVDKDTLMRNKMLFENEFSSIVEAIFSSPSECPEPMRVIYANLEKKIIEKYSPKENDIVRYTVVNSFLILRLFVPAFLTPTVFQLMPDFPAEHTSRSLTLLGKSLQNLANFTHFGEKDNFMAAVNEAITDNIDGMKTYYSQVTSLPKDWTESPIDPVNRQGNLERELSLLLELIRAKHSEIRAKVDVSNEFFGKLMNACHVVVKVSDTDNHQNVDLERGEKGGGGSTPNELSSRSSSSPSPLPSPMQSPSFFEVDHLDSNTEKPAEDIPFPYTISDENDVEIDDHNTQSSFGMDLSEICESAQKNLEEFHVCYDRMKTSASVWDFFEAIRCRDLMLELYGELSVSLKMLKRAEPEEEEEKRVNEIRVAIEEIQIRMADQMSAFLSSRVKEVEEGKENV